jgi:hypothetical protein
MLYVEMAQDGTMQPLHHAPYLDYRPLTETEPSMVQILARAECHWITPDLEDQVQGYAIQQVVPEHIEEVKTRRLEWVGKTRAAVQDRLTKEINHWDHRAEQLRIQEQSGKPAARLNSGEARRRADELSSRLEKRLAELEREAQVSAVPPVIFGGLVVVPVGLLQVNTKTLDTLETQYAKNTQISAAKARAIIMDVETKLGFKPTDREFERLGYDIESLDPKTGQVRFLEVKGRITEATTITVTRNEILTSLNKPDNYYLAIVEFLDSDKHLVHYIQKPFKREPDFAVTSVNYHFQELLESGFNPLGEHHV